MARLQAGDVEAFDLLYARYAHPLANFFYQMCFDRTAADDYVQETFLRVWRARQSYRPIGKLSTWLFQIAKHYWFNEREKQKRRPFHAVAGGDDAQSQFAQLPDAQSDFAPEAAASAGELETAIERAVLQLSDKLRAVFVLARYRGLPYAEIAEILEIPVGTVKSRMSLAEKQLRGALGDLLQE
ncbi:MAG: sigma-70 family RNA polymerase sigma factor [Planctomycetota bacterium]